MGNSIAASIKDSTLKDAFFQEVECLSPKFYQEQGLIHENYFKRIYSGLLDCLRHGMHRQFFTISTTGFLDNHNIKLNITRKPRRNYTMIRKLNEIQCRIRGLVAHHALTKCYSTWLKSNKHKEQLT